MGCTKKLQSKLVNGALPWFLLEFLLPDLAQLKLLTWIPMETECDMKYKPKETIFLPGRF